MLYCPYCGKEIISNSEYCSYCGENLNGSSYRIEKSLNMDPQFDTKHDRVPGKHANDFLKNKQYQIIDSIGLGGEGNVYLVQNRHTQSLVAIKELPKENGEHILEEINALSKLNHPSIPKIYDCFTESDHFYIVEDYVPGQNLSQYVRTYGSFSEKVIYSIALKLCDVLEFLYVNGIIYGDIKPSNIMLSENAENIVLIDFGSIVLFETGKNKATSGTVPFSAPEVLNTYTIMPQSDIYSFGIVLFYLCTGEINISKFTNYDENISYGLQSVIKKCTEERPADRYQNYSALQRDLLFLSQGRPPQKKLSVPPVATKPHKPVDRISGEAHASPKSRSTYPAIGTLIILLLLIALFTAIVQSLDVYPIYFLGFAPAIVILVTIAAISGFIFNTRRSKNSSHISQLNDTDSKSLCTYPERKESLTVNPPAKESCDEVCKVFISYKQEVNGKLTKDYYMAQDLFHELAMHNIKAFFSHASMKQRGDPSFESAIHEALESSLIFVAVGSDKVNMNSRWVKYERETFHALMMNGTKGENAGIFSYIAPGFSVSDLPPMLSSYNSFSDLNQLVNMIETRLNKSIRFSMLDNEKNREHNAQRVNMELIPGFQIVSRYLLLEQKKEGSYYKLFKAKDQKNGNNRLIKVINRYAIPDDFHDIEADLLNNISCPGIPKVYEYRDNEPDYIYTVMDYYNGFNLETLHRCYGRLDRIRLLQWIIDLCHILYILHKQDDGFVHCNVKPSNIFIEVDGSLNLINFSSACRVYSSPSIDRSIQAISMMYAAPEQFIPRGIIDVRTDIYAVGCTMLTMLTDVSRIFPKFFTPESFGISQDLSEIICKCMRSNPDERYQNDLELINDLKLAALDKYICRNDVDHLIDFTSHIQMQPSQTYAEQTLLFSSR